MLRIGDPTRREFLRVGGVGLGGLSLASPVPGAAGGGDAEVVTGKAVVFLFLHGGPSQFETFDPKMAAPAEVRSATGEVRTAVPGLTFGASFPKLAARADRLAVVRSFVPGDANHDIKPVVCKDGFGANLGSAYASAADGATPPGLPTIQMASYAPIPGLHG